jgi:hypothetical protein
MYSAAHRMLDAIELDHLDWLPQLNLAFAGVRLARRDVGLVHHGGGAVTTRRVGR